MTKPQLNLVGDITCACNWYARKGLIAYHRCLDEEAKSSAHFREKAAVRHARSAAAGPVAMSKNRTTATPELFILAVAMEMEWKVKVYASAAVLALAGCAPPEPSFQVLKYLQAVATPCCSGLQICQKKKGGKNSTLLRVNC